jgi:enamine deaminase RidA (YjgF/YER057c/UK114 family)
MGKRQRISGPDIPEHVNPFPAAVKVGNIVFSGAVLGKDPLSKEMPEDLEAQVRNAFQTVRNIMRRAGGGVGDIAEMTFWLRDRDHRRFINPHWLEMFPDEDDRPTRHVIPFDLPKGHMIHIRFTAVI